MEMASEFIISRTFAKVTHLDYHGKNSHKKQTLVSVLASKQAPPISLTLPLTDKPYVRYLLPNTNIQQKFFQQKAQQSIFVH